MLPKAERRKIKEITKRKIWIYGGTTVGKTYFANKFENPLMLNTDGNIQFVDSPYLIIKDQVTKSGRLVTKKKAWVYFKEIVDELEVTAGENGYDTIIVDLVEDLYQMCRFYIYDRENIDHESDDSFKAYDMVTYEFLPVIQKLLNLPYKTFIFISHEDLTRDIMSKGGKAITQIKPNLRDKIATKIAGSMDLTARVTKDSDGNRWMHLTTDEVTFGGGRPPNMEGKDKIKLDIAEFNKLYEVVK